MRIPGYMNISSKWWNSSNIDIIIELMHECYCISSIFYDLMSVSEKNVLVHSASGECRS